MAVSLGAPANHSPRSDSPDELIRLTELSRVDRHRALHAPVLHLGPGEWGRGLQCSLLHPPEQLLPLRRRHGVAALQQVGDDQGLLGAGRPDPDPAVHSRHQLAGEELVQVGPDVAVGRQQSVGGGDKWVSVESSCWVRTTRSCYR